MFVCLDSSSLISKGDGSDKIALPDRKAVPCSFDFKTTSPTEQSISLDCLAEKLSSLLLPKMLPGQCVVHGMDNTHKAMVNKIACTSCNT